MISFMRYITIVSRCANRFRDERLAGSGLYGGQTGYIMHICRNPGVNQDQLAVQMMVNRSNVTRQLAIMEENGFVTRKQSEADKRAVEVYPTEKATAILPQVLEMLHDWREYLVEDFSTEEKDCLLSLLERVAHKAENYQDRLVKHD